MSNSSNKDNEFVLKRFGRYLLLDHLVNGGMAKICRARYLDEKANKIVAIKMIQSKYSDDEAFIRMFLDEVKVSFGLIHPNIAQTYDTGMVDNQLYTVMEYVDGKNLKQFMDRLKSKKYVFPIEISLYIISQVCQGLSYAHSFTDKLSGEKVNIIHRDISPHNIMITYDGAIKVIDFGIAKASTNTDSTQAGTIKGKLSYLAPEYIDGMELDHRYDQFAVGITLWELLCSRKLFNAGNDIAILKEIQKCKIPHPSSINPNVTKELDDIVLKALSKDRTLRYENMEQFNRAIVRFLYSKYPEFNPNDLNYFSQELFKDMIKTDRAKLFEMGKIDIAPYMAEMSREGKQHSQPLPGKDGDRVRVKELDLGFELQDSVTIKGQQKKAPVPVPEPKKRFEVPEKKISEGPVNVNESRNKTITKIRIPKQAPKERVKANARIITKLVSLASVVVLLVGAFIGFTFFKKNQNSALEVSTVRTPSSGDKEAPAKPKIGLVKVLGIRSHIQSLYFDADAEPTDYKSLGFELDFGEHTLRVEEKGKYPHTEKFTLNETTSPITLNIPELRYGAFGELLSKGNYSPGTYLVIELNGAPKRYNLPLSNQSPASLPVGVYEGEVKNEEMGVSRKVKFEIQEDKRVMLPY